MGRSKPWERNLRQHNAWAAPNPATYEQVYGSTRALMQQRLYNRRHVATVQAGPHTRPCPGVPLARWSGAAGGQAAEVASLGPGSSRSRARQPGAPRGERRTEEGKDEEEEEGGREL